jgi:hypothetical protein
MYDINGHAADYDYDYEDYDFDDYDYDYDYESDVLFDEIPYEWEESTDEEVCDA